MQSAPVSVPVSGSMAGDLVSTVISLITVSTTNWVGDGQAYECSLLQSVLSKQNLQWWVRNVFVELQRLVTTQSESYSGVGERVLQVQHIWERLVGFLEELEEPDFVPFKGALIVDLKSFLVGLKSLA
jgi:hypothetical protein